MLETNTLRSHHDLITIFVSFTASDLNFVVPTRYLLLYRFILYKSLLPRRAKRKKKKGKRDQLLSLSSLQPSAKDQSVEWTTE